LPYVLEVACGWHGEQESGHRLYGYNCAPSLAIPFRDLHSALHEARIGTEDVLTLVVHLLCPRLDATDRGKTAVTLPSAIREDLIKAVRLTCQEWTKVKREDDLRARRGAAIREKLERQQRREQFTVKEAAWVVMEQAYMKASDNGRLPANARQIMYGARPEIIDLTGKAQPWTNSAYFTQTLLPDFMDAHAELTAGWDVVFDARGHFAEPHTGEQFGIGTLEVRKYIRNWQRNISMSCWTYTLKHEFDTVGPYHRYAYVLFVEKEGFNPLIERAQISQRYDMPVMSTKGMTVTAARQLIEALSQAGVTILVAHDFDKSGIEILDKFQSDTRRYRYSARPRIVDLGLRLDAARAMSLESEQVQYNSGVDPRANLRHCGATVEECAFLVHGRNRESGKWYGERIELNAMTSQQFLTWLEEGLVAAGVAKVVPDEEALLIAYKHQKRIAALQAALDKAQCELSVQEETIDLPANLAARIREKITNTTIPWDDGLWQVIWEEANDE